MTTATVDGDGESETPSESDEPRNSVGRLGSVIAIAVSLFVAFSPLYSVLEDLALVTGVDVVPAGAGFGLLAAAIALERTVDRPGESFFVFAVATLTCRYLFAWAIGLTGERLELAGSVLLAETLVFVAAVATAIALTFDTDW